MASSIPTQIKHDDLQDAKRNIRDVAEEAGSTARQFLHNKSEQVAEMRKQAEDRITTHPLQSVAIAAVGGLLLGALLRR